MKINVLQKEKVLGFIKKIKENTKSVVIIFILIFVGIVYLIYSAYRNNNPDINYEVVKLENHDLSKSISIDGQIFSDYEIDLASEIPGIVQEVYVQEGDYVQKGQPLMKLKDLDYRTDVNIAYVNEQINKVVLDQVLNPNHNLEKDINISQNNQDIINDDIDKLESDIISDINELNIYLDQVLRLDIDKYFDHTETYPVFTYRIQSKRQEIGLEESRAILGVSFKEYINLMEPNLGEAIKITGLFESLVSDLGSASMDFLGFSDSALETIEIALFDLRNDIVDRKDHLISSQNQLNQLVKQLDINIIDEQKIGNVVSPEDVRLAEEKVRLAQVQTNSAYLELQKTNIRATRSGLVVDILADEGEYVNSSSPLIKIISENKYVKALVPEVDISKVKMGMVVEVVLDAFLEEKLVGVIDFIYPAEEESQGVVYYEIRISLDGAELDNINILPGMSLEVFITYQDKKDVMSIERNIGQKEGDRYFVQVLNPDKNKPIDERFVNKYFEYGFIGDRYIEVTSGLDEGDKIIKVIDSLKKKNQ